MQVLIPNNISLRIWCNLGYTLPTLCKLQVTPSARPARLQGKLPLCWLGMAPCLSRSLPSDTHCACWQHKPFLRTLRYFAAHPQAVGPSPKVCLAARPPSCQAMQVLAALHQS